MAKYNHEIFNVDTVSRSYATSSLACLRNDLTYLHDKDLGERMYEHTHSLNTHTHTRVCMCINTNKFTYFVEDSKSKGPLSFLTSDGGLWDRKYKNYSCAFHLRCVIIIIMCKM
jgi:hypothetical protein